MVRLNCSGNRSGLGGGITPNYQREQLGNNCGPVRLPKYQWRDLSQLVFISLLTASEKRWQRSISHWKRQYHVKDDIAQFILLL